MLICDQSLVDEDCLTLDVMVPKTVWEENKDSASGKT